MARWGICTTLKAPLPQVLAFVAHHLELGADRIWLYFDDPNDPAIDVVAQLPRVETTRCDAAYWAGFKAGRPDQHQNRQGQNMRRCYKWVDMPWICHIDVDEFILANGLVAGALDTTPQDVTMVRMSPWEALHDPGLIDDIFTARHFRAALRGKRWKADRNIVFGNYAFLLPEGTLSHASGKCFFRTGLRKFHPRLHGAVGIGVGPAGAHRHADLALLHFHAQDRTQWLDRLPFRLERGAYRENIGLTTYLQICGEAGLIKFYDRVQTARPDMLDHLREIGALIETDLNLSAKVAKLRSAISDDKEQLN